MPRPNSYARFATARGPTTLTASTERASMLICRDAVSMHAWSREQHAHGRRIGCVPTMGALHAGHIALIEAAHRVSDVVAVSIFVNPLQFNRGDDFDHYPRPIDDDVEACRAA